MKKRNFKVGLVVIFLAGTVFFLAGCGKKEELNNTQENKFENQNRQQSQKTQSSDEANAKNENNRTGNPPEEMTSACSGKSEGDICEVTMPPRNEENDVKKVAGKCTKMQDSEALICRSENMPGGPGRGALQGQTGVNTTE